MMVIPALLVCEIPSIPTFYICQFQHQLLNCVLDAFYSGSLVHCLTWQKKRGVAMWRIPLVANTHGSVQADILISVAFRELVGKMSNNGSALVCKNLKTNIAFLIRFPAGIARNFIRKIGANGTGPRSMFFNL